MEQLKLVLEALNIYNEHLLCGTLNSFSPVDGSLIGSVTPTCLSDVDSIILKSQHAYDNWRTVPAPQRGELVRLLGEELRYAKNDLGMLVSIESGKILSEGLGEVQEMIDICDFAVGISRQLYGLTISTERPGHRMMETWHPLGITGIITAFNFPVAVWAWNAALALVCGNSVIWKPSEKTPLCALAVQAIFERACKKFTQHDTEHLSQLLIGTADIGKLLVNHPKIALISATGSTHMGNVVAQQVAARFGRSLLELGGNNAIIVSPSADIDMAVRAIAFSAAGTAGQRCTSARRLIIHESVYDAVMVKLSAAYNSFTVGTPLDTVNLVGPLIDKGAYISMQSALAHAIVEGGKFIGGNRVLIEEFPNAYYVRPALVKMPNQLGIVRTETFAPILYVLKYSTLKEAIDLNNAVDHGLSSSIFTLDIREAEIFMSAVGSDCGIVNVNIGTSGAEIGGAFGGEKHTGGGRESGSDSWKNYMRRATNTINYSKELPLAQGVKFDLD